MRKSCILSTAIIMLSTVSGADADDIVFSIPSDATGNIEDTIDVFSSRIAEYVDDTVRVEITPQRDELLSSLQAGDIQIAGVPPEWLAEFNPNINTFALPFVFEDVSALEAFSWSPEAAEIFDSLQEYGLRGFSYWPASRRVIFSWDRIESIADLEGLSMGLPPNQLALSAYRRLGVSPTYLAPTETYTALQTGAIDTTETTPDAAIELNLDEVLPFAMLGSYTSAGLVIVASTAFWDNLSEEVQQSYLTALSAATNSLYATLEMNADVDSIALAEAGFTVVPPSQQFTLSAIEEGPSAWSEFGIDPDVIEAAHARTRGGGDYCSIDMCRCINRECSGDCCPERN